MRSPETLLRSVTDMRSAGGDTVPPANVFILGYRELIPEPLLIEAIANHPGCGEVYYVPMDHPLNEGPARAEWNAHVEALPDTGSTDFSVSNAIHEVTSYSENTAADVHVFALPARSLLQRFGGPPLNAWQVEGRLKAALGVQSSSTPRFTDPALSVKRIEERLDAGLHEEAQGILRNILAILLEQANEQAACTPDAVERLPQVSTAKANILINATHEVQATGFYTRRGTGLMVDNDPAYSYYWDSKCCLPWFGQTVEALHGVDPIPVSDAVGTLDDIRHFMDEHGYQQIVAKDSDRCAGNGIFRIWRETPDGPLLAEEPSRRRKDYAEGCAPMVFSPTEHFVPPKGMLVQEWLDNDRGDIRAVILNGRCVGAYMRHHGPDSWLCNYRQGGSIHPVDLRRDLSAADRRKLDAVAQTLHTHGIDRASVDLLANNQGERFLSEINIGCTDDIVELHAHDLGRQAQRGHLSLPDQIAADIFCDYRDTRLDRQVEDRLAEASLKSSVAL